MICGNSKAKNILQTLFDKIESDEGSFGFILLEGPKHIGKTKLVQKLSRELLGDYYDSNFLYIPDLSEQKDKTHSLKVDVKPKDQIVQIDDTKYQNMGARQIIDWLNKSSLGSKKVVYIENIERMTRSASNAMLKTFEEPKEDKLIIASTSNAELLIDTIISRSFIVKFQIPEYSQIVSYLSSYDVDDDRLDSLISFYKGRIGLIIQALENDDSDTQDIIETFEKYLELGFDGDYSEKLKILKQINKKGKLNVFLEALVYYYSQQNKVKEVEKIFYTQKLIRNNINMDNALFHMML